MAAFAETYTSSHEEWLEQRNRGLGGSDASAILGLNGYKTPYGVWLEKTGRVQPADLSDNEAVYWGTVLEDVVAREFAKRHADMMVRRKKATLASKERPWQLANVDRVIKDTRGRWGVLEIKTAGTFRADDWAEGIPDYYLPQCIHYLAVTGYDFFAVAVLIGGQKYKEYFYERDAEDVAYLNDQEAAFWNEYVLTDTMPPVSTGDGDALLQQHPAANDEYLQMLDADVPQIEELRDVTALIKRLEADKKRLANELKVLIGDSAGIQTPTMRVTWPRSEYTSFDSKAFKEAEPELAAKYETTKTKDGGIRMTAKKGA